MPALDYKGPAPTASTDLVTYDYVASLLSTELSTTQVNDRINANLAGKVLTSYVDTQDALNATQAYVDAGDATRLKLTDKDVVNGVLALGPSGRAAPSRFNVASTQRFSAGVWTPSAYNSAITGITGETTTYSMAVSYPGFAYKVVVFGLADVSTSLSTEYPIITVRDGSTSGTVIAEGRGTSYAYGVPTAAFTDDFEYTASSLRTTDWSQGTSSGFGASPIGADGHNAYFNQLDNNNEIRRAIRANAADATTSIDTQIITATVASIHSGALPLNEFLLRVGTTSQYVLLRIFNTNIVEWHYNSGFGESGAQVSTSSFSMAVGDVWTTRAGVSGGTRNYEFYSNGSLVLPWNDAFSSTAVGSSNRGWGIGMGQLGSAASAPARLSSVTIDNGVTTPASFPVNVIPINYAAQSVKTGATTLFVRANRSGSAAQIGVTGFLPELIAFAIPA